jgi:hypothetical protein
MSEGVTVGPDAVRAAGTAIVATADELHRDVGSLAGNESGAAGANVPFLTTRAVADCAAGWEQALDALGADLAVAGDNLTVNAAAYAATERTNRARLGGQ